MRRSLLLAVLVLSLLLGAAHLGSAQTDDFTDPSKISHQTGTFDDLNSFAGQGTIGEMNDAGGGLTKEQYATFQMMKARRAQQKVNEEIDQAIQSDPNGVGHMTVEEELAVESRITDILLAKCQSKGRGPMQIACAALKKGMAFGSAAAKALSLQLDIETGTLSGILDLSFVFGKWAKTIQFELSGSNLILTMPKGAKVTVGGIVQKLSGNPVAGDGEVDGAIVDKLKLNSLGFTLNKVVIALSPLAFKLEATLDILNLKVPFSIVAGKIKGFALALFVNIDKKHADDFLSRALSPDMRKSMDWFKIQNIAFGFTNKKMNFADNPDLAPIDTAAFGDEINKGFSFMIKIKFDKYSNNAFGKTLGRVLGGGDFYLKIWVNAQELGLSLGLPDFNLDKNGKYKLVDNNLFLKWKFPADLSLGVSSTLSIKMEGKNGDGSVLTFKTSLYLTVSATGPPTVTVSCIMKGWWDKAFGIKPLSVGDLAGQISITTVPPFVASFEINGKAKFGEAQLSIGLSVDLFKPVNSWFYADAQKLTLGTIINALTGRDVNLPKFLADTGFPDQFSMSFAFRDAVSLNGREIPEGFQCKGRFNFLGYNIYLDVIVSTKRFKFYGEFDPIKFANGLVQVSRSKEDTSKGPLVNIDITFAKLSALIVEVRGYVRLFIFEAEVQIYISSKKLSIDIMTVVFGIFKARVQLHANYASLATAAFSYQVDLEITYFLKNLADSFTRLNEMVQKAFEIANKALEDAKKALEKAKCDIPKVCGYCDIELSSLSLLEVHSNRSSNAERSMLMTAYERAEITDRMIDQMEKMDYDQMVDAGFFESDDVVWTKQRQDRSLRKIQAWHDTVEEERMRQYRKMHRDGQTDIPKDILIELQNEAAAEAAAADASKMSAAAAVDRLRAEQESLRSGHDDRQRSDAEIEAILEGDASVYMEQQMGAEEDDEEDLEERGRLEMEAMMEDEFGIDLEFHEAHDILDEIRLRRLAAGKSPQLDEEDYDELEKRFLARREERKPILLERAARRRARHFKRTHHEVSEEVHHTIHDHLQHLSVKQLTHLKHHVKSRKAERYEKLQQMDSEEAKAYQLHKAALFTKVHDFHQHNHYHLKVDDHEAHEAIEESAEQLLSEIKSTLLHEHDHADHLHDMVHVMQHHRAREAKQEQVYEQLYQQHKALYKAGMYQNEAWQIHQQLLELDEQEKKLKSNEYMAADVAVVDHMLDQILEAERGNIHLHDDTGYGDHLHETMRKMPRPHTHAGYGAYEDHLYLLPQQWQNLLAPHAQLDFTRKVNEHVDERTGIEVRRRLYKQRLLELEQELRRKEAAGEPLFVEASGEMMEWMDMLDARDKEIEAARAAKRADHERAEREWFDAVKRSGMDADMIEAEAESLTKVDLEAEMNPDEAAPWECYYDNDCRPKLTAKANANLVKFNRLWQSNSKLQDESAQRIYEMKVELCGWKKIETESGITYAPPAPPPKPEKAADESDQNYQVRLNNWTDQTMNAQKNCAVDYDPCPANIPCSKSIVQAQFQLNQLYQKNRQMLVPILDPPYVTWGVGISVQNQACWDLDNPMMTTMCIEGVQKNALEHKPATPKPNPPRPHKKLGFFARIGCQIKRAFCIVGCTIKNVALTIAQGILTAAQGILSVIRWVISKVTELLSSLAKNIEISVMFGMALNSEQFKLELGFHMKFYPVKFDFKLKIELRLSSLSDLFKAMLKRVWDWFLSKVGLGKMKSAAEKNPAINDEMGMNSKSAPKVDKGASSANKKN